MEAREEGGNKEKNSAGRRRNTEGRKMPLRKNGKGSGKGAYLGD